LCNTFRIYEYVPRNQIVGDNGDKVK